MRGEKTPVTLALCPLVVLSMALASADVAWDHTLTDPADDVVSAIEPGTKLSDRGEVDILSASVSGQGDDVNVTLTLAGPMDDEASYEVSVTCDGDDSKVYTFTLSFGVFSVTGFDLVVDDPEAYISSDLAGISWVVGKAQISAGESVVVTHVQAMLVSGMTNYIDTAPDEGNGGNGGNGGGGDGEPASVQASIVFVRVEHVRYTVEVAIEGDDAKDLRAEFDMDVDGTVTRTEYDQHIGFIHLTHSSWNSTDLRLDGKDPASRTMTFEFQGLVGSAASTSPVNQVMVLDVMFDEPGEETTHTYADFLSSVESTGEMWHVTTDSLFTVTAPDGWRFRTDDWPGGARTYLGGKGSTMTLSGFQMRADWNDTVGMMGSLVITERSDGTGEDTPGFGGVVTAGGAMAAAVLVIGARRRR